jgi:hypothetical protein
MTLAQPWITLWPRRRPKGVGQMTRTDRWLQTMADAALWLLFRLARVRS